jgi:hypothetical protein
LHLGHLLSLCGDAVVLAADDGDGLAHALPVRIDGRFCRGHGRLLIRHGRRRARKRVALCAQACQHVVYKRRRQLLRRRERRGHGQLLRRRQRSRGRRRHGHRRSRGSRRNDGSRRNCGRRQRAHKRRRHPLRAARESCVHDDGVH